MKMKRLVNQLISIILILGTTLSCSIFNIPIGAPSPDQEVINAAIQGAQSGSMEELNQSEQDVINLLREQSGARAAFGDQADTIFQQIDQARAAAVQQVLDKASGAVITPLKVSALITKSGMPGTIRASPLYSKDYQVASTGTGLGILAAASQYFKDAPRDANGFTNLGKLEGTTTIGKADLYVSMEPRLEGSILNNHVTIIASVTDPFPYSETMEGNIIQDLCPDAEGLLPIQFSFSSEMSLGGGGQQLGGDIQATGHVDDEASLTSYDFQSILHGARQPIKDGTYANNAEWGSVNKYFEYKLNGTVLTPSNQLEQANGEFMRKSSDTNQENIQSTLDFLSTMAGTMIGVSLTAAELLYTTGYCVAIQVPELGSGTKSVQPNSDTPFTATVHHKFEGIDLQVPVIATLSEGQVSVSPSGSKVPAPANFTYKAPGEKDKSATVNLVTRSKRGIATLDVKFKTGEQGWKVDWTLPNYFNVGPAHFTGMSCSSPYGPWEIKMEGTGLSGSYHIPFSEDGMALETFEEQGNAYGGSIGYQEVCSGNAAINPNSGGYQIELPLFTCTGSMWAGGVSGPIPQPPGPGLTFPITPADPGQCSQP